MPVSALPAGTVRQLLVPGLILFTVLGVGPLGAAALAWHRHPIAPLLALGVGLALLIWIAVQIALIGTAATPHSRLSISCSDLSSRLSASAGGREAGWIPGRRSALRQ